LRIDGVTVHEFEITGNHVAGIQGDVDRYMRFLLEGRFDIVTNFAAQQWSTDLAFLLLGRMPGKKVFVPTGFSGLYRPEYRGYFESMKVWMRKYDSIVLSSEEYRDAMFARACGAVRTVLIPNGAGEEEFLGGEGRDIRRELSIPPGHFLILHVGSHTGWKGHEEAIEIFRRAKIRNAILLIVGDDRGGCFESCVRKGRMLNRAEAFLRNGKRLMVSPLSRRETVAVFKSADLLLFPSNIECSPIVLFESMASRTPFLVTDVGNSREVVAWSNAGALLPTVKIVEDHGSRRRNRLREAISRVGVPLGRRYLPEGYCMADVRKSADVLEAVYADEEGRRSMAEAGFAAWKERFTWEKIALQYETLYRSLLAVG
jgi:glycosyltransferase involved in cell wall biosynthesis